MCRNNKMVQIDGNKLRNAVKKLGMSTSEASQKLGFSQSYITKTCTRGNIRESSLTLLNTILDIKYDDIKPDPVVEECQEPEQEQLKIETIVHEPIDYEMLESSIRNGVRSGIIDVLISADSRATLMEILKNAYKQAIRENLKERLAENSGKLR